MTESETPRSFPWLLAISLAIPVILFAAAGAAFAIYGASVGADALVRMPGRGSGADLVSVSDAARFWLVVAATTAAVGTWIVASVARKRRRTAE
ncbi:hypothetical protein [Pseudoclavibacter sp. VKM Ac-2867]|uniref:hypothetical protein n=1 Tax=Pseudoclavibacter sp. VKM Ac-2867 TaxID=2783829 RepID=UPI00188BBB87|nr:hypothetical protein [Pseudoclavibacter sp. VKM Ac-2867]MBF4459430.1 hypothetical protein [Pseudoclavibacter sp. VKM Ac-2867]